MEHVAAQAREYGHAKRRELSYLVVHSVLHLLGYDHLDEGPQKAQMRAREEAILGSWASGGESLPGQAPAGAQAQQESVDGGELQVFHSFPRRDNPTRYESYPCGSYSRPLGQCPGRA